MLLENVRSWFGGVPPSLLGGAATTVPETEQKPSPEPVPADRRPAPAWSQARVGICEELWGEGFLFPGGSDETMRLARPLGLSSAASLLLIGAGAGGPTSTIATQLGVWVTGFETDPDLAALAMERNTRAGLGRRAQIEMWYPEAPAFRVQAFHHALALEPLRAAKPEPLLAAIHQALRPAGQLVMVELVADEPLDRSDPAVAIWHRIEGRTADLRTEQDITRMLGRLGYDVRVVEDISKRHMQLAMIGWRNAVRLMNDARPAPAKAGLLVGEAEVWLRRLKLMREGRLRMIRWHAFGPRRDIV